MFDIGFWELLLIAIVALVVVGPERLPKLIRVVGLWVGKANASVQSIRSEISRELRAEELKQALNKTVLETEQSLNSLKTSVDLTNIDSAKTTDKTIKDNNGNG
ncbi:MAG: twin-arginine translocase subunit TatB [Methylococcaceae bacterium]|nr:twin-arginine translocase subunit TatB [Methylococcaceae bacterium]